MNCRDASVLVMRTALILAGNPDARIECTLDSPGALISIDASSIFASCVSSP
jgi:hypothetical protein